MKTLTVEQGSAEWRAARLGIPTASQFHRILTPKTRKPSSQAPAYLCELLAERLLGMPLDGAATAWTERGTELEQEAALAYEIQTGVTVERVGLVTSDDGRAACSPDRLAGEDGGVEIKCPALHVHLRSALFPVEEEHASQVQGALWLTGRAWWDLVSYVPGQPMSIRRIERDEEHIEALESVLAAFCGSLDWAWERVREMGYGSVEPEEDFFI